MALACNIDQRGRSVRYRIGLVFLALGVVLFVGGSRLTSSDAPSFVAGGLALAGLFSLFEANRGWCLVRALGFKTKV